MSTVGPVKGTIDAHREARCNNIRRSPLLAFMLCGVVLASQALAGEQTPIRDPGFEFPAPIFSPPFVSLKSLSESQEFSATEFRPRTQGVLVAESAGSRDFLIDAPMLNSNSVWQHMADFRSQGRLRLLTLFQTRGSSLSLQAGKHGAPSLQWSTPWVHREGASRGLFDHLLPMPQHTAGGNTRSSVPRPAMSPTPSKTLDPAPASNTK